MSPGDRVLVRDRHTGTVRNVHEGDPYVVLDAGAGCVFPADQVKPLPEIGA